MSKGELVPKNGQPNIKVNFDLRFATSTKNQPLVGVPVGKSDFFLEIKAVTGAAISAGDYDLKPDESKIVFGVSNSGLGWSLKTVTF